MAHSCQLLVRSAPRRCSGARWKAVERRLADDGALLVLKVGRDGLRRVARRPRAECGAVLGLGIVHQCTLFFTVYCEFFFCHGFQSCRLDLQRTFKAELDYAPHTKITAAQRAWSRRSRLDFQSCQSDCAPHITITAAQRAWSAWISKTTSRVMRRTPRSLRRSAPVLVVAALGIPELLVGLCAAHQDYCGAARLVAAFGFPKLPVGLCTAHATITAASASAGRSRRAAAARQSGTAPAARASRSRAARAQSCRLRA